MGDDHNCYLAKLITDIYEAEESEKDDKNHEMPAHQKSYHPLLPGDHKDIKGNTIYYMENKKKAMISTDCVAEICATLEIH